MILSIFHLCFILVMSIVEVLSIYKEQYSVLLDQ
jgi:hypothetical protein